MRYRLTYTGVEYYPDSCSGPGWGWRQRVQDFATLRDMTEALCEMQAENAEERHHWDNADPKWRGEYHPRHKDFHIEKLVLQPCAEAQRIIDSTHPAYDTKYAELDKRKERERQRHEQADLEQLRKLQERYPNA